MKNKDKKLEENKPIIIKPTPTKKGNSKIFNNIKYYNSLLLLPNIDKYTKDITVYEELDEFDIIMNYTYDEENDTVFINYQSDSFKFKYAIHRKSAFDEVYIYRNDILLVSIKINKNNDCIIKNFSNKVYIKNYYYSDEEMKSALYYEIEE